MEMCVMAEQKSTWKDKARDFPSIAWYYIKVNAWIIAVCFLCWIPAMAAAVYLKINALWLLLPWYGGTLYTILIGADKRVKIEDIEYFEYDCGHPCTEDGCIQ